MALKRQVDELVGRINVRHGIIGWTFHSLIALYNVADVALITPLRDGMNLIAKFIATKADGRGVLIITRWQERRRS
ncbi:MAG: Trehalose-6-phosphate synthase [Candidatus Alkanophagales archaeon MCA70_species_1]|nr:Trehalose-6-phosphate synthase [Candidatus Alkanophaga volatiphilum]